MPLVDGLPPQAAPLHTELVDLVKNHSASADSFFYNGGTVIALLATGAATVLASTRPLLAAICSGSAAFVIAVSRALNFGGRWRWHLQRQNAYRRLIYHLNEVTLLPPEQQTAELRGIYDALIREKGFDDRIPGSGEPVDSDAGETSPRFRAAHDGGGGRGTSNDGDHGEPRP